MIEPYQILILIAAAAAAVVVGFLLGRIGRRDLHRKARRLNHELSRSVAQNRDQSRKATRQHEEQSSVANFVLQLPYTVQELNRDDLDPREVPKLIVQMAHAFFAPEQIVLYLLNPADEDGKSSRELHLAHAHGLSNVPGGASQVTVGAGKIGWVAEHQVEMAREDWLNRSLFEGPVPLDDHPTLMLDLMGPLVHHGRSGNKTLGVLCLGQPATRTRDVKLMLQMVTNLATIALIHSRNLWALRSQANHDGLTGLLNKRHFMQELGTMIFSSEQNAKSIGLFIFDIDHFKQYNDTNGHPAGDELLRGLAKIVRANLRPGDIACRYGGEEFVVAMPETDGAEALHAAERIRTAIENHRFAHEESQPAGRLTISGGVASFPVNGTNGTELLSHADQALYKAKATGRNRVVRFEGVEIGSRADDDLLGNLNPAIHRRRNAAGDR
jgi:diguanylate cyclase (GGDEF)-like protein